LQEVFFKGVSLPDRKYLESLIEKDPLLISTPKKRVRGTAPGTTFERLWKGQRHFVTYHGDSKYEYDGKMYQSLSAIARENNSILF
jgi:hypothetical protein